MKRSLAVAFALLAVLASATATPAFANFAWGNFLEHNFVSGTVVKGLRSSITPYWSNPVAWGSIDKRGAVVLTVLTDYYANNEPPTGIPDFQVALLFRANTKLMDVINQLPGDSTFFTNCSKCKDGTVSHEFKINRVTNGWTLYMDGSSVATRTGSFLANDFVTQSWNQVPVVIEVADGTAQTEISNTFRIGRSHNLYYAYGTVGSLFWSTMTHARAYYDGASNTDHCVGCGTAPTWTAVNDDGATTTKWGTTTHLTRLAPDTLLW